MGRISERLPDHERGRPELRRRGHRHQQLRRVPNIQSGSSRYPGQLNVIGNYLLNNFGGIAAFQDRNRFCGEGADGGDDTCTLNGSVFGR